MWKFWGRCWIWAAGTSLYQIHSNAGSKLHVQPMLQLVATLDSLTHWVRPEIEPSSSWTLCQVQPAEQQQDFWFGFVSYGTGNWDNWLWKAFIPGPNTQKPPNTHLYTCWMNQWRGSTLSLQESPRRKGQDKHLYLSWPGTKTNSWAMATKDTAVPRGHY